MKECDTCLKYGSGACYALGANEGHVCFHNMAAHPGRSVGVLVGGGKSPSQSGLGVHQQKGKTCTQ
jgi:hypothetical protein